MKTTTEMQLVPITKLVPYVNNARTHSPEQIAKLRSSLREFGFINPVIIDRDFNVIAGHGRILAAKEEGIAEIPCVFADHLSEAQKKAYIIADNRMAMDAGWDEELLRVEIESLQGMDFDPLLTGFDEKELADLFADDSGSEARDDDFDLTAALEKASFVERGDVWTVGRHRLVCGDATSAEDVAKLMDGRKANLIVTDPPYGVSFKSASGLTIQNDSMKDEEFYNFLLSAFQCMAEQWKASDVANTLNTHDIGEARCNELAVRVYGICSKDSNAMKSENPKSGFYEASTSRCLDANGGNPTCNQGGMAVVAVQGSMIGRADKNGPQGGGVNEDVSFTLDAADRHAVAYCMTTGTYTQTLKEQSPTLLARDYKDPPVVNETEPEYIVRRLTPTECARLQGFPDWWCAGFETDELSEEEIKFWTEVFETHRSVMGKSSRPKSRNQIIKWLKNPHSDSAEYKMWGNGVALPNVYFVLSGIVYYSQFPEFLL